MEIKVTKVEQSKLGSVDFDNVFQLLKNNNYKQDFILQTARGKDDVQTARDQLNFIKVYISKYFQ